MKMVKKIMALMLSFTIAAGTFNLPAYAAESAEADEQSEESMESALEETVVRNIGVEETEVQSEQLQTEPIVEENREAAQYKEITKIEVISPPEDTDYYVGAYYMNYGGLVLRIYYADGTTEDTSGHQSCLVDGRSISYQDDVNYEVPDTYSVWCSIDGKEARYNVRVLSWNDYYAKNPEIPFNTANEMTLSEETHYFSLKPDEDAEYRISATTADGEAAECTFEVYKDGESVFYQTGGDAFNISLEAGIVYQLSVNPWQKGNVIIQADKLKAVSSVEIITLPTAQDYMTGEYDTATYEGMELKVIFEDGTEEMVSIDNPFPRLKDGRSVNLTNNADWSTQGEYSGIVSVGDSEPVQYPIRIWAEIPAEGLSGMCGDNLTWTLDAQGCLTIAGTGRMYDYIFAATPWFWLSVQSLDIQKGVTSIGQAAFYSCGISNNVVIPEGVTEIGNGAFGWCFDLKSIEIPQSVEKIGESTFNMASISSVTLKVIKNSYAESYAIENSIPYESVTIDAESIKLNHSNITLTKDNLTAALEAEIEPGNTTDKTVHWISSNPDVATVGYLDGIVQGVSVGTATITATTSNGKEATCQIDVQSVVEAESIEFVESEIVLNDEKTSASIQVNFTPENVTDKKIWHMEWTSSDRNVVRVYGGTVYAVGTGTATVIGKTSNGKTATCKVTVEKSYPYRMVDGVQYHIISENEVEVAGFGTMSEPEQVSYGPVDLKIPASITADGKVYKVTSIGYGAFESSVKIASVTLEEGLESIDNYNLIGTYTSVTVPKSVKGLGVWAFRSSKLTSVVMLGDAPKASSFGPAAVSGNGPFESYEGREITISVPYGAKGYDEFPWTNYKVVYREPEQKLSPTENLKAVSAGKQKVKLTWSAVKGAEGYLVYGQKNGQYGYVGMTTKGTSYTDVKALDSDYNFYWVFPYVKDGNGKMLPGGCKKYVYAKGVCPAVTNLKAASGVGQVKLTWKASAGAEGYLVYGKTATGKYEYKGMTTKGTTYAHKSASKTEYNFYWVFPYHRDANGKMIVGGTPKYVYGKAR